MRVLISCFREASIHVMASHSSSKLIPLVTWLQSSKTILAVTSNPIDLHSFSITCNQPSVSLWLPDNLCMFVLRTRRTSGETTSRSAAFSNLNRRVPSSFVMWQKISAENVCIVHQLTRAYVLPSQGITVCLHGNYTMILPF